jgi:hypothetical protein
MDITKEDFLKQLTKELHTPVKKMFPKLKVRVPYKDHTWSMDLVDMTLWADYNDGYKYILNIIDIWTRYAWSVPLKKKTAKEVLDAFKQVIAESKRIPEKIWVDQGTEFYNQQMTRYLAANNMVRYSTHGQHKACMIERLNRTLKTKMWREFTEYQTNNWINRQVKLLEWYNHKEHSGIGNRTPYSVSQWPNDEVRLDICIGSSNAKPKFQLRHVVRVSRAKGIFEKGYTANWSQEQFTIIRRRLGTCDEPPVYYLRDHQHNEVKGLFYEDELQLVKYPLVYLVEAVLQHDKKNKRMLIKWLGFNDKHNSWIPEDNIIKSQDN